MRKLLFLLTSYLLFFGDSTSAVAQCAMCRATVVNNVSNGEQLGLAASLNTGIVYLFIMPYLLVALIGFLWYRSAKSGSTSI
ncbi:MAG: hypothetical protein O2887_07625 [Bacteroidetes bacterium]|nr:hypothetical protein [Bacteroidota bacterium]MDA1120350.1 hypothetical protein [Bacteroidota bacterium]